MTRFTKIRFLVAIATVSAVVGTIGLVPGSAAGAATSQSDCDVLESIGDTSSSLTDVGTSDAAATAAALSKASKQIDEKRLKGALKTMSKVYKQVGGAKNKVAAGIAIGRNARKYGLAAGTFSQALLSCVSTQLTLPPGVTLPSGATLPTIPR